MSGKSFCVVSLALLLAGLGSASADIDPNSETIAIMRKVCDWQLEQSDCYSGNGWRRGALFAGIMAMYETTQDQKYLDAAMYWADLYNWQLIGDGIGVNRADDHCAAQTYLELYFIHQDPNMFASAQYAFDYIMDYDPMPGREDWWWCDALFMSPPVWVRLAAATEDANYCSFMNDMFWDVNDYLYDNDYHLYYRDDSYFDATTANGEKVFWSRGNGWVVGGIVRVLQYLPQDDPRRNDYIQLLQEMAGALAEVQGADGLWRSSLLDYDEFPNPETSGTGFFCYAIAWGINEGILDAQTYLPVVEKAWYGLGQAVHEDGKLGWVQRVAGSPGAATWNDTEVYAVGAFLLAGSEVVKCQQCTSENRPAGDLNGDCKVDCEDLELMTGDWLNSRYILAQEPDANGLVGRWTFDEGTGDTAGDSSGLGHHGTVLGNKVWVPGVVNTALSFDSSGDYVDCGTFNPSAGTGELTLAMWAYWNGVDGSWQGMASKRDKYTATGMMWDLCMPFDDPAGSLAFERYGRVVHFGVSMPQHVWTHVTVTVGAGQVTLYLNGTDPVGNAFTMGSGTNVGVALGALTDDGGGSFNGMLDEVHMYNYALSQPEVLTLAGKDRMYLPVTLSADVYEDDIIDFKDFSILADNWLETGTLP